MRRGGAALRPGSERRGFRDCGWRVDAGRKTVVAEDLVRGTVAQHLAGAVVEPVDGLLQPLRVERAQVLGLGHELAQEAVGMFIEAPLAGAVGTGQADVDVERDDDLAVADELLAFVAGEGQNQD